MSRRLVLAFLPVLLAAGCATGRSGAHRPPAPLPASPEEGVHYRVYMASGAPTSLEALLSSLPSVDVLLLGEEHPDRLGHRLQEEILRRAYVRFGATGSAELPDGHPEIPAGSDRGRPLVLSMEMFERDVQPVVDEYLTDVISREHFEAAARPWDAYDEDYAPLVEFARAHGIPVVAANAPRRYVNLVSREGREALRRLSPEALGWLAPLPYPEPSERYRAQWDSLMGDMASHGMESLLDAQALWDATMAHSIARALEDHPDALVIHVVGGFHVENRTGVPEALLEYVPDVGQLVVAVRTVEDVSSFDPAVHAGRGDYVILTDDSFERPSERGAEGG